MAPALGSSTPIVFSPGVSLRELAAKDEAAHDDAIVGERIALDVLDDLVVAAMRGAGIEQCLRTVSCRSGSSAKTMSVITS